MTELDRTLLIETVLILFRLCIGELLLVLILLFRLINDFGNILFFQFCTSHVILLFIILLFTSYVIFTSVCS